MSLVTFSTATGALWETSCMLPPLKPKIYWPFLPQSNFLSLSHWNFQLGSKCKWQFIMFQHIYWIVSSLGTTRTHNNTAALVLQALPIQWLPPKVRLWNFLLNKRLTTSETPLPVVDCTKCTQFSFHPGTGSRLMPGHSSTYLAHRTTKSMKCAAEQWTVSGCRWQVPLHWQLSSDLAQWPTGPQLSFLLYSISHFYYTFISVYIFYYTLNLQKHWR